MNTPHKHATLIKAWADGAQIQFLDYSEWRGVNNPKWEELTEYRIKPEPKPDVGMGAERELAARARIAALEAANAELLGAADDLSKALSIDSIEHEDWPSDSRIALRNLRAAIAKHQGTT